ELFAGLCRWSFRHALQTIRDRTHPPGSMVAIVSASPQHISFAEPRIPAAGRVRSRLPCTARSAIYRRPFWCRPFLYLQGGPGMGKKTNCDSVAARLAMLRDALTD